ncbi:MAG: GNAT family N-acetyltransferase [Salinibacter sp.]
MPKISTFTDPAAVAQLDGPPSASTFERDAIVHQAPDLHLTVPGEGTGCAARCSLWWTDTPACAEETVGLVGHYAAADAAAGRAVLGRACRRLADEGCTCAVGPMDGATWYPYRFVTERGRRPPFVLEPWHPPGYPAQFRAAGFEPLARYVSSVGADADTLDHTSAPDAPPLDDVRVRSLDLDRFEEELRRLHGLVTTSFADNVLYTPLPEAAFVALHRPYRSWVEPGLVRLLEQERAGGPRLVGVALMVPDRAPAGRGEAVDTAVFKTLAVHPDVMGRGLGRWLTEHMHARAGRRGYEQVLHALMHEDNVSRNLGHGPPIRRYTLFRRPLS